MNFKFIASFFCIGSLCSCGEPEESSSSFVATKKKYNLNGVDYDVFAETIGSFVYDRQNVCENDGYRYSVAGPNLEINMVGSIQQETKNITLDNREDIKSLNAL